MSIKYYYDYNKLNKRTVLSRPEGAAPYHSNLPFVYLFAKVYRFTRFDKKNKNK